MKVGLFLFFISIAFQVSAQKGDELLVYSLTGNVTVVENNAESKLKIGKVLKPGSTIKTQRLAKLTLVCKQGKPISITKEGTFPVERWKDSCNTGSNNMTTKYFQFIWDQLYVRSDDYKNSNPNDNIITDAPLRGQDDFEVMVNPYLDTVFYNTGSFPLSWSTSKAYSGKYFFRLYNAGNKKLLYKDSIAGTTLDLSLLRKYLKSGNSYYWTLTTSKSAESEGGVIKMRSALSVKSEINKLKKSVTVPEDLGAQNFRLAFLLQESRYIADAYAYYRKAVVTAPEVSLYREKLEEFKKEFGIN